MFTGIIESIGEIIEIENKGADKEFTVLAPFCNELKIGDSISINGACQSVIKFQHEHFSFFSSQETLSVSSLRYLKKDDVVNLERALKVSSRLDGHIVTGHIDATAKVVSVVKGSGSYRFAFKPDNHDLMRYIVDKASVTIHGISLTVYKVTGNVFECAIIPLTYEETNLHYLKSGSVVNVEADILAKYVEGLLNHGQNRSSVITKEFLNEHGY